MANLGKKKLYFDFSSSPETLEKLDLLKKKIQVTMTIKLRGDKLEIDVRGSKDDVKQAIEKIKDIMRG